jgi:hypothetical protein
LNANPGQAKRIRDDLLSTHLHTNESGRRLRHRVNEILRVSSGEAGAAEGVDLGQNLENFDPYDPTHLFWDRIKQLGFALRDIRREDVMDEETMDQFMAAMDGVSNVLHRIEKRRKSRG